MRSVRFHDYGPPEVLKVDDVPDPEPGEGQLLVQVSAAGISYAEIQIRGGVMEQFAWFPDPPLPHALGFEVAGTVVKVGEGVGDEWVGRKVVGVSPTAGGYSELAVLPVAVAQALPEGLSEHEALALYGQGVVAVGVAEVADIQPKDIVLVEAAAGGVGSLLVQLAKNAGAEVIALARGEKKLALARELGADHAFDYTEADWAQRVREVAPAGVQVVLDSVGGEVSQAAFDLLAMAFGRMVVFGTASGKVPQFDPEQVYVRGVSVTGFGPRVFVQPEYGFRLRKTAFELAAAGTIKPVLGPVFPLAEAAEAHRAFEERVTTGKVILVP
ncbi:MULTISPECIES: quinone oxidoreductase family protein [Streptomyces]|uniref:quinone oxidoreductase family protein n=1 Tax=Streptomyces TaxID=1883 RepID=UPI001678CEEE|nr:MULTISPECIES: zinc-binding dehydrogenase [Streptomyces]MBK3525540.1 zinc-binding dehydrogenase [Streptomyces sp. MBT70]GGR92642.1 NADPH:quinone reductase [Streptomyces eurythermus]